MHNGAAGQFAGARDYDIAIVGAGVAGCYCAYRLSAASPRARIVLLEQSNRIGGRLETAFLPGVAIPAELGGAFVSDSHARVSALAGELGLALTPVRWSRQFAYVRGKRVPDRSYREDPDAIPYRFAAAERGRSPAAILRAAIEVAAPRLRTLWPADAPPAGMEAVDLYLQCRRFRRRPLDDWPFATLLGDLISNDGFRCLVETSGASSNFGAISAYDAIRTLLREGAPQQGFVFSAGFQQIPLELQRRSGVDTHLSTRLTKVRAESDRLRLWLRHARGESSVLARALILTSPPDSLVEIGFAPDHANAFRALVAKLAPVRACKLFLSFSRPWWPRSSPTRGLGVAAHHTDQPLQQCYAYDGADGSGLLLAMFADGDNAAFWRPRFDAAGAAAGGLVEAVLAQLRAMHGDVRIPDPSGAVARMWPAAWHGWKPGARSWRSAPAARQPVPGLAVFVCGEAYSTRQGWVEGALESADALLEEKFLA
ncbi:MAG: flavin monoamine oxidase family protein [Hyphomonadaceae bacterium]